MSLIIDKSNIEKEVFESNIPVILDFYSDYCMPCKMLAPVLEEISEEYGAEIKVAKVNTDHNQDLAAQYGIMAVPTLLYIKNGQETDRTVGVVDKEEILEKING